MENRMRKNHVVLLKSPKDECSVDPYVKNLEELGFTAQCIPVLSFNFINIDLLYTDLMSAAEYSGLILTSPRAVEAVKHAVEFHQGQGADTQLIARWKNRPVFVVGMATASAVKELGLDTIGEETGNAENLVPEITKGIGVHGITVYETVPHPDVASCFRQLLESKEIPEYLVYFSPSGIQFTHSILHDLHFPLHNMKLIAIGPTTEKALKEKGLPLSGVLAKPSPESLQEVMHRFASP